MNETCPDLEVLFTEMLEGGGPAMEHAKTCTTCSAILAEHRALESELFRLSDPMPPSTFVPGVMQKVATAPAPARKEIWAGLSVLVGSVGAGVAALIGRPGALQHLGIAVANTTKESVTLAGALPHSLGVVFHHAAVPVVICTALLMGSLYGLKKLAGSPAWSDLKVSP